MHWQSILLACMVLSFVHRTPGRGFTVSGVENCFSSDFWTCFHSEMMLRYFVLDLFPFPLQTSDGAARFLIFGSGVRASYKE